MNCANCGNVLPPGARVCPNCGTPVPNVFPAPPSPSGPPLEPTAYGNFGPFQESRPSNPPTPAVPDNAAQQRPPAMPQGFYSATGYGIPSSPEQYQPPAQQPFPPNQQPFQYPSQQPPYVDYGSPQQAPVPNGQQSYVQPWQPQQYSNTTQENVPINNPPAFPGAPPQQQPYPGQPGQTQEPPPRPKSNLTRIIVLAAIALVVIIAAVVGIFAFTTNQHNQQVAATGTASSQTRVAQNNLNATATQSAALATATQGAVNATATAANTFPAVAGNYTGTLTNSANGGKQFPMGLLLQQNQQTLTGTCTLATIPFPIQNGTITLNGQLSFSITVPATSTSSATQFQFTGTRQSDGSLSGTYTASGGGTGPWSVTKS